LTFSYRALEFDRIREALADQCSTRLGQARALALEPSADSAEVRRRLATTGEAVAFEQAGGSLGLDAPEDLDESLTFIATGDEPLAPLALLGVARFLDAVQQVAGSIGRAHTDRRDRDAGGFPTLAGIARGAVSFSSEVAAIRRAVLPTGDIADHASPALRDIRDALRRQRAKLRSTLEGLTRDSAKYLQDQIITDRNGRYVVVVRAEHRGAVPGIVHGSSGSGASLYLEPLATVELNNDVVALTEREREEIHRILLGLTNALRRRQDELDALVATAAELDELHGKARLSTRLGAVAPAIVEGAGLELLGARHPLLESGRAVPSDLTVMPPIQALVISGPNTGGKTVALKAFGLLALMAQAGLFIPVEAGSRFAPFQSIFADIGDEQSIAASLSTFSAHVANLVAMERALEPPALVLLDEVGGGTDPSEGGALGAAVIDHFRRRGAIVIATTHDDALKSFAATTAGVRSAGFGFDPATYAPTYRLIYDAPGRSLGLEIAARLGLPDSVIADARTRRSGRESQLAAHLALVDKQLAGVEEQRQAIARDRHALDTERKAILDRESRLTEREAILRTRLDAKLNEHLRTARAEVDAVVTRLKQKADALTDPATARRGTAISTGDVGGLRSEARDALGAIEQANALSPGAAEDDGALDVTPSEGDRVFVTTLGADGIVRGVGRMIEVEIRGKRLRVPLSALRRAGGPPGAAAAAPRSGRTQTVVHAPAAAAELVLIGSTVDAAIDRAEKFLDAALLGDERRLRVVHGHGTGKLREALRTFFRRHPLVASVSAAPANEGGDGATIIELKD
jgi:DNA mismatch repair protein MutS2